MFSRFRVARQSAVLVLACIGLPAASQLRIATYNVTNYSSGRIAQFQTIFYSTFEGRQFAPDVIIGQEFLSGASVNNFLSILNTAPGSPADWAAAPFVDGPDTDSAFFYRTGKISFIAGQVIAPGEGTSGQPRNTMRYDFRPIGYASNPTVVSAYSVHLKAGSTGDDQTRRLGEAQKIRDNAEALPGYQFLVAGDYNIQSSGQAAYQEFVGSQSNNLGRFFDPINTPGAWNNGISYRFVHTQDPSGAGGMDDRLDIILTSAGLLNGLGMDYIGNPSLAYSTSTWNDPNHSYRCWGNDGTSFDSTLKVSGNTMVGPTIAQALKDSTGTGGGHLPVFLDVKAPPKVTSPTIIDFGLIPPGVMAQRSLLVSNPGDVVRFGTNGVAPLKYTLTATSGFTAPSGTFTAVATSGINHTISVNTATPGIKQGIITIASDAPDEPVRTVIVRARVLGRSGPL